MICLHDTLISMHQSKFVSYDMPKLLMVWSWPWPGLVVSGLGLVRSGLGLGLVLKSLALSSVTLAL